MTNVARWHDKIILSLLVMWSAFNACLSKVLGGDRVSCVEIKVRWQLMDDHLEIDN